MTFLLVENPEGVVMNGGCYQSKVVVKAHPYGFYAVMFSEIGLQKYLQHQKKLEFGGTSSKKIINFICSILAWFTLHWYIAQIGEKFPMGLYKNAGGVISTGVVLDKG